MAAARASGAQGFRSIVVQPAATARTIWTGSAHPVRAITRRPHSCRISSYPPRGPASRDR